MTRTLVATTAIFLAGCDFNLDKAADFVTGRAANQVVLSSQPIVLTQKAIGFGSNESMKVMGEATFVCVVLKDGVVLQNQRVMDQLFADALHGAKISVAMLASDGTRVPMHEPMQGWAKFGKVLPQNELSACASMGCKPSLPAGTVISKIEISSAPDLRVNGVYWESDKSPIEKRQELLGSKAASVTNPSASCKS
jgi:hypothetical protein